MESGHVQQTHGVWTVTSEGTVGVSGEAFGTGYSCQQVAESICQDHATQKRAVDHADILTEKPERARKAFVVRYGKLFFQQARWETGKRLDRRKGIGIFDQSWDGHVQRRHISEWHWCRTRW